MVKEFNVAEYDYSRPLVIYGAGIYGEYTYRALETHDIQAVFFCDRAKSGTKYLGLDVFEYSEIKKLSNPIVLLAVGAAFNDALDFLLSNDIKEVYSIFSLVFKDSKIKVDILSQQGKDLKYYEQLYLFGMDYRKDQEELKLFSIDFVITEKCSLKCKECSNLMQYYEKPINYDIDVLIEDMNRLLDNVDEIMDVRIIGGEPFMSPKMYDIIAAFIDSEKIRNFSIYTNATINPKEKMIELLKNPKVKCEVSDYGSIVSNYSNFIALLENNGIRFNTVKHEKWHKLGKLENRHSSIDAMKTVFKNCHCNDLLTMMKGKIYRCPYSANGRVLKAIPENDDDCVDLYAEYDIRKKLKSLIFNKDFDYACGYCSGRNFHIGNVEPAVQTDKPLPYEKCQ